MRQDKVKRMSCRVLAPSPAGRGDRRCALCDKHFELNLAPMGPPGHGGGPLAIAQDARREHGAPHPDARASPGRGGSGTHRRHPSPGGCAASPETARRRAPPRATPGPPPAADRPWLRLAKRPGRSGVHGAGGLCWAWSPSGHRVEAIGDHRGGHGFIIAREAWRRDLTTKIGGMWKNPPSLKCRSRPIFDASNGAVIKRRAGARRFQAL